MTRLTAEMLLRAYAMGIFPMAESATDEDVFWCDPPRRGIMPLEGLHISHSLAKALRRADYELRIDHAPWAVLDGCADREVTWINAAIRAGCAALWQAGHLHTVEIWRDGALIGGLYGVRLGGAFFGESMFSRARDASKLALVHLVERLRAGGFQLLDMQFLTPHLASLGGIEISRAEYRERLKAALAVRGEWPVHASLQPKTHTS